MIDIDVVTDDVVNRTVVRIRTSYWHDSGGMYVRKNINFLKRKCIGHNISLEDCYHISAEEVIPRIENLYNVDDGLYELVVVNQSRDFETGCVEDWDYRLLEYRE